MASGLSSNWKNLQASLKEESWQQNGPSKKRPLKQAKPATLTKRRRVEKGQVKSDSLSTQKPARGRSKMEAQLPYEGASKPTTSASLAIWAADNDIPASDLIAAYATDLGGKVTQPITADRINAGLMKDVEIGQYIAMDCEMVGVGGEEDRSVLARVSIVNFHGMQIYDSFVRPKELVTDWRTHVSGISSKHMASARSFEEVQEEVAELLKKRVLVGHAIKNDLEVLMLSHPIRDIRDTSKFVGFRKYSAGRTPSLKKLAKEVLGVDIQAGEHSSIEDARATMLLFRQHRQAFDAEHSKRFPQHNGSGSTKSKSKKNGKKR